MKLNPCPKIYSGKLEFVWNIYEYLLIKIKLHWTIYTHRNTKFYISLLQAVTSLRNTCTNFKATCQLKVNTYFTTKIQNLQNCTNMENMGESIPISWAALNLLSFSSVVKLSAFYIFHIFNTCNQTCKTLPKSIFIKQLARKLYHRGDLACIIVKFNGLKVSAQFCLSPLPVSSPAGYGRWFDKPCFWTTRKKTSGLRWGKVAAVHLLAGTRSGLAPRPRSGPESGRHWSEGSGEGSGGEIGLLRSYVLPLLEGNKHITCTCIKLVLNLCL